MEYTNEILYNLNMIGVIKNEKKDKHFNYNMYIHNII
jgi:hypothetical protein